MRQALVAFAPKPRMVKATLPEPQAETLASPQAVVLPYKTPAKRQTLARATTLKVDRGRRAIAAAR
jgi:hypothetical protein